MFKLSQQPIAWQLTIRVSNLISTYGSDVVLECLRMVGQGDDDIFDSPFSTFKTDSLSEVNKRKRTRARRTDLDMLYIQIVQIERTYGVKTVSNHIDLIYGKVA